jgi:hypothetical protein
MRLTILACSALLLAADLLPAQVVKGKIVTDSGNIALPGVLITLLDEKGDTVESSVRSDNNGDFTLRTKDPGRYRIRTTRLGFQPVTTSTFELALRTIVDVRLTMSPQAALLGPMIVIGSRALAGADMMSPEGFEYRRRRQAGHFADTASIRRAGYPPMTTALKEIVPGLSTVTGVMGTEEIRMTVQGKECIPDLYKDGTTMQSLQIPHINLMNSRDFYGVEVYRRPNVPLEFRKTGFECGVIAIWSRWMARGRGGA